MATSPPPQPSLVRKEYSVSDSPYSRGPPRMLTPDEAFRAAECAFSLAGARSAITRSDWTRAARRIHRVHRIDTEQDAEAEAMLAEVLQAMSASALTSVDLFQAADLQQIGRISMHDLATGLRHLSSMPSRRSNFKK